MAIPGNRWWPYIQPSGGDKTVKFNVRRLQVVYCDWRILSNR